ncbi:hypothetical protein, variant [Exophiala oligosperma]|uniref:Protein kinase domain-containing protein n=1 Tax=Exophiala oligosperma TaxID=215243 RepID=A0A0D2DVX8_9EURO|nr:hypothetical protein, variant [Exophiala oligosperma]KIW39664.1 hypothetical protein, variant [Exophiala oligosperma]
MQTASCKRKFPLDPPPPQEHPHKRLSLGSPRSWEEEFFANSPGIPDWIWASDVDREPLRFHETLLELVRPFNHPVPDAPAQVWLARGETGFYAVKLFKPYADDDAKAQAARLSDPKPSLQKVRHDFSPFALETRAYERIRKFCPASQQSFFRRYHGTIEIPASPLGRSSVRTSRRQGIVFDVLTIGLEGRRLHSAGVVDDSAPHAEALRTELAKLDVSPFEKKWYSSVLNDRLRMAMSAHALGVLHGDIKPDCFGLPNSPHDIALHDFSRAYTFTRERPYAMNGILRLRTFKHAVEVERRNIRSCVLEMAKSAHLFNHFRRLLGLTEEDTRTVLSSAIPRSLLATELPLIVLSVGMTDDGLFS